MKLLDTAKQIVQTKVVEPVRKALAPPATPRRDPWYSNDEHVAEVNARSSRAGGWIRCRPNWLRTRPERRGDWR